MSLSSQSSRLVTASLIITSFHLELYLPSGAAAGGVTVDLNHAAWAVAQVRRRATVASHLAAGESQTQVEALPRQSRECISDAPDA